MRLVIAGVSSGVGKTTLVTGIAGALRRRALHVQPFKAGPDYIDPSYHSRTAGMQSRNLDTWMLPGAAIKELYQRTMVGADIALIEGVMGLFDGRSGLEEAGSTAELAKLLAAPVILVVDVSKMSRSAGAIVLGFQQFDPRLDLRGVILNNVGGDMHRRWVTEAIEERTGLRVLGHLKRVKELTLPERHLGLIPTAEGQAGEAFFEKLVDQIEQTVDIEALLDLAQTAQPIEPTTPTLFPRERVDPICRIAVAMDEAFSFYYQDNLDLLSAWGAEIVPFSPLHDQRLPDGVAAVYIGGGFPEVYATALETNERMRAEIVDAAAAGMPVYGECGGLMYLARALVDAEGHERRMAGVVPFSVAMQRRVVLGYATVRARNNSFLLKQGEAVRGHEFHYSTRTDAVGRDEAAYEIAEQEGRVEGYASGNLLASYVHLHFGAHPPLAARFVAAAARWRKVSSS